MLHDANSVSFADTGAETCLQAFLYPCRSAAERLVSTCTVDSQSLSLVIKKRLILAPQAMNGALLVDSGVRRTT